MTHLSRKTLSLTLLLISLSACATSNTAGSGSPDAARRQNEIYAVMPKETLRKLANSVFEVVIPKKEDDFVTYERPLPFDKLPFQIRNDKFIGLGTAFALGGNHYLSAAHVFKIGVRTLIKDYGIRDRDGGVHKVGKIYKYSNYRDLIEFDLKDPIETAIPLELSDQVEVGDEVFTAGNVLGEGISYRGGQISSFTPEEIDGKWKNIRFSAPASPGNSGGPLLNSAGQVVGVVSRRNTTENLNFATPTAEIRKLSGDEAEFFDKHLQFKRGTKVVDRERHDFFKLPETFEKLSAEAEASLEKVLRKNFTELYSAKNETDFPDSPELKEYLTHQSLGSDFGMLESDGSGGNWKMQHPQMKELNGELGQKIHLFSSGKGTLHAIVERPPGLDLKGMDLKGMIESPKSVMDSIVKAAGFTKTIAEEKIRVFSYGEPHETSRWKDRLGRTWLRSTWNSAATDMFINLDCLPVPKGLACIMASAPVSTLTFPFYDLLKEKVSQLQITYSGTLAQWKEYLKLDKDLLPNLFHSAKVAVSVMGDLNLRLGSYALAYKNEALKDDSRLDLRMGFTSTPEPSLEILRLELSPWNAKKTALSAAISHAPLKNGQKEKKDRWDQEKARTTPYDGKAYAKGEFNRINIVLDRGQNRETASDDSEEADHLNIVSCWSESNEPQDKLVEMCQGFRKGVSFGD